VVQKTRESPRAPPHPAARVGPLPRGSGPATGGSSAYGAALSVRVP
jgi:hypothetical protein